MTDAPLEPRLGPDGPTLTSWHADWSGLRVAVLGLGKTGFAVADTLVELGAEVLVVAASAPADQAELLDVIGARLVVEPTLDAPPAELLALDAELLVVSPGFTPRHALLVWARESGIPIWGDIELAWRLRDKVGTPARWTLVTGTNGKTTTTQLAASMLVADGRRAAPVGNIGVPVLDAIRDPQGFDDLVVELSSYQLHALPTSGPGALRPIASACLNIADDHLDWHGSAEAYVAAKAKVYENTIAACVYNRADAITERMVENADVEEGCRAIGFGLGVPGRSDFGIVEGVLCDRAFLDDRRNNALEITTLDALRVRNLSAPHTVSNVLAAAALVRANGVAIESVRRALDEFSVDAHRTEKVAERDGIVWIDDSKATNPHAADAALRAYSSTVWIVGGQLKGVDIGPLVAGSLERLRAAVVLGADRREVVAAFRRHAPALPLFEVLATDTDDVMAEAVRHAAAAAQPGDVVLLAPAAASMDQFESYSDRGRRFARAVHDLLGGADGHTAPPLGPTV